jgi:calmodulin|tara:strand:+ start:20 stop:1408 length:1389 start_codon:yes stop_codon:yes gene_type:complete
MGFYMLPEDRVREDAIIAGEHAKRTHIKGLRRNKGGHTQVLIKRLRVGIEARAPKGLTARAVLRREFALIDQDKSGAVDLKEFVSVVKRYLNGAEPEDLQNLFRTFDQDGNGTVSIEEFTDKLLKEAGPHNYRHKTYKRTKPPRPDSAPVPPPSSRPRSGQKSQWTAAVRNQAGKTLTTVPSSTSSNHKRKQHSRHRRNENVRNNRDDDDAASLALSDGFNNAMNMQNNRGDQALPSRSREHLDDHPFMGAGDSTYRSSAASSTSGRFNDVARSRQGDQALPSSQRSQTASSYQTSRASSSDLGSRAHSLRFAHRHVDHFKDTGAQPLTRGMMQQHMATLMIEEMTVQFLSQFRRAVRRSAGKEKSSHKGTKLGGATLTERVLNGDAQAANTLVWTMSEFAKKSSSSDKTRLNQKRFQASLNIFRGSASPVDENVARLLWAASGKGKIKNFVERCFPTVKVA